MLTEIQRLLVTLITQALFYGIYIATFIQCFRWLIFADEGWKPRERVNSLFIAFVTIFIFLTSTTNLIAVLQLMLQELWREEMSDTYGSSMAMDITGVLAIILIDSALIYRCWIVYEKSWRVICVPATVWVGSLTCSTLFSYYGEQTYFAAKSQIYLLKAIQIGGNAMTGLYVCNIVTTIYTTAAIIYRIWCTTKITSGENSKRFNYVMRILVESGILYTFVTVFCLVASELTALNDPTWVEFLLYDIADAMNFSMAGISFNLILIRVYESRVETRDSMADSRKVDGEQTLSRMQFNNHPFGASSEGPSSNVLNEATDEIQEHHRSSDRMHEN